MDNDKAKTEPIAETEEDTTPVEDEEAALEVQDKKKRRRRIVWLCLAGVLVVGIIIAGVLVSCDPSVIEDNETPLSSSLSGTASSGTALSGAALSGAASNSVSEDGIEDTLNPTSSAGAPAGQEGSSNPSRDNTSSTGPDPVGSNGTGGSTGRIWHDGWEEQVWVDTSGYQSVWVGENPIYAEQTICNECGSNISGFAARHIYDTGHFGYRSDYVQVDSTPIYEDQWVSSGYWTTVYHDGYWE